MNAEQRFLTDLLLACCARLASVESAPIGYLDDVAKVCAMLRPAVADADTPEMLCFQRAVWTTEEVVLTWVMHGRYAEQGLPTWLMGDAAGDYGAWRSALAELAEIRGVA